MSGKNSTYVLIPGAWHGGWSWRPVAERLRAAGHRAICLTLPGLGDGDDPVGLGLKDAVDHVVSEVERLGLTDVTLVGHSWAGYPLAGAAHRLSGKVSKVVYYAAQVPVRGRSMVEDNPPEAALYILGEDDRALPRPGTEFAARLGLEPVMVPGTHEGMLTHPDEVAKAILNG
jgi:pimeloyl-ACP methyl ester carboxylesterase